MNKIEQKNTLKNSGFKSQATLLSTLSPQNFGNFIFTLIFCLIIFMWSKFYTLK